ncbi:MAG: hypothetical protein A2695_01075 [Candidatus Levybacteria bacterium RIFCSPHIGHO2_01_FULL_40_83]|nr:MAG: hypothetical protein A2695_01075 [Candidatus Levybacteria bacterium RIFCSPHIGHO2_01_FULL_40_83]
MFNAYAVSFEIGPTNFSPAGLFENFGDLATTIITVLVSFAGALSIIFIIIAGFKFVTSSGDEKKLASASSTLTYAIIGLAVTILAFVILRIVQHFIGSNVEIT